MTLNERLADWGAAEKLARKVGVSAAAISRIRSGKATASLGLALLIEQHTGVRAESMISDTRDLQALIYVRGAE